MPYGIEKIKHLCQTITKRVKSNKNGNNTEKKGKNNQRFKPTKIQITRFIAQSMKFGTIIALIIGNFAFIPFVIDTRVHYAHSRYSLRESEWVAIEQMEDLIRTNASTGIMCFGHRTADYILYTGSPDTLVYSGVKNLDKTRAEFEQYREIEFGNQTV